MAFEMTILWFCLSLSFTSESITVIWEYLWVTVSCKFNKHYFESYMELCLQSVNVSCVFTILYEIIMFFG